MIRSRTFYYILTACICSTISFIVLSSSIQANSTITTIYPSRLKTTGGSHSDQPLSVLNEQDQSGVLTEWNNYLEFYPNKSGYIGKFTFELPDGIATSEITGITLKTNYLGQAIEFQSWQWKLYDYANRSLTTLGDNSGAADWQWTSFSFYVQGEPSRFVNRKDQLLVQYTTTSNYDDSDLDYLALVIETDDGPVTPTPLDTPTPVDTPTPIPEPGDVWQPEPGTSWQLQLQGTIDTSLDVDMYVIDLFDTPQDTIDQLHADGRIVICYFSAGSWEDWRPDAGEFPDIVKGRNNGWPGEKWLDIRQLEVLDPIMVARLDEAVLKGCDGVDPDNVDGYSNNSGFPISYQDQLAYNSWIANQAHARDLSVGLKNDVGQIGDLLVFFDWALNEQCFQYNECETLAPFIEEGKAVFGVSYKGKPKDFCPLANEMRFSWLKLKTSLDGSYRVDCLVEYP